jgi:uncharacterized protein (TIGR02118 family)
MICVMSLIQTATDITEKTVALNHDAMVASVSPEVTGAVFNLVTQKVQRGISYELSDIELDAIGQFFFPDISSSMSAASLGGFNLSMGLPGPLVADLNTILCVQNTVIAPPSHEPCVKRMSVLRKHPEVSTEEFQDHLFSVHAILAKRLNGVMGYRQNLVIDGPRNQEGHFMVDGMIELWFQDEDAITHAFQAGQGHTLMAHAREFISEISTFMVDPERISGIQ